MDLRFYKKTFNFIILLSNRRYGLNLLFNSVNLFFYFVFIRAKKGLDKKMENYVWGSLLGLFWIKNTDINQRVELWKSVFFLSDKHL